MEAELIDLFAGLDRLGPGTEQDTLRALRLTGLAGPLEVVDLGAGTGAASLVLLKALPEALVTAVDREPRFLARAEARAREAKFEARFTVVAGDMAVPPVAPGTADLIWCEGAIHHVGVVAALEAWRPFLSPRGVVVFSEPIRTVDEMSPEPAAFWSAYPGLTHLMGVRDAITQAGYSAFSGFALRETAWEAYYAPLQARERALRAERGDGPGLAAIRAEIDLRDAWRDEYGYAMFLARPKRAASSGG